MEEIKDTNEAVPPETQQTTRLLRHSLTRVHNAATSLIDNTKKCSTVAKFGIETVEKIVNSPLVQPATNFTAHKWEEYGDPILDRLDERLSTVLQLETKEEDRNIKQNSNEASSSSGSDADADNKQPTSFDRYWDRLRHHFQASQWFKKVDEILVRNAVLDLVSQKIMRPAEFFFRTLCEVFMEHSDYNQFLAELKIRLGAAWDDRLIQPARVFFATAATAMKIVGAGKFFGGVFQLGKQTFTYAMDEISDKFDRILIVSEEKINSYLPSAIQIPIQRNVRSARRETESVTESDDGYDSMPPLELVSDDLPTSPRTQEDELASSTSLADMDISDRDLKLPEHNSSNQRILALNGEIGICESDIIDILSRDMTGPTSPTSPTASQNVSLTDMDDDYIFQLRDEQLQQQDAYHQDVYYQSFGHSNEIHQLSNDLGSLNVLNQRDEFEDNEQCFQQCEDDSSSFPALSSHPKYSPTTSSHSSPGSHSIKIKHTSPLRNSDLNNKRRRDEFQTSSIIDIHENPRTTCRRLSTTTIAYTIGNDFRERLQRVDWFQRTVDILLQNKLLRQMAELADPAEHLFLTAQSVFLRHQDISVQSFIDEVSNKLGGSWDSRLRPLVVEFYDSALVDDCPV